MEDRLRESCISKPAASGAPARVVLALLAGMVLAQPVPAAAEPGPDAAPARIQLASQPRMRPPPKMPRMSPPPVRVPNQIQRQRIQQEQLRQMQRTTTARLPRPNLRILGSTGPVIAVVYAPDGRFFYTLHDDDAVRAWDTAEGAVVQTWKPHQADSDTLAISPDGRLLATGAADGRVVLLAPPNEQPVQVFAAHQGAVRDLAFHPGGPFLATVGADGFARVWNTEDGSQPFAQQAHQGAATAVAWSADSRFLFTGGADGSVRRWAMDGGGAQDTTRAGAAVTALAAAPDGRSLAIGTAQGKLLLWDFTGNRVAFRIDAHDGAVDALDFTADGRTVVSVGADRLGRAWAADSGRESRRFAGHAAEVNDAAIAPGGRFLVTASDDGTARLWNFGDTAELARAIATERGWATLNPIGQFDTADGRFNDLQWLAQNRAFGLDNLSEAYYEPGLLARLLAGDTVDSRGLPPIPDGFTLPPAVRITSPDRDITARGERIEVTIAATDAGAGVGEVRLYHNQRRLAPARITDRGEDRNGADQSVTVTFAAQLIPGDNVFRASAFSPNGVESEPASVKVFYGGTADPGRLHVLSIGINEYANPALNLNYGVSDAEAVGELVDGSVLPAFGASDIGRLYNRDADRKAIRKAFKSLGKTEPQDSVIVYYAGHGLIVDGEWYLVPADVDQGTEAVVAKKGISADELLQLVMQINAQSVLMMIDSCQSGGVVQTFSKFEAKRTLRTLSRRLGIHLLAATEQNQLAVEFSSLGHGAFTYVVLQGARGPADQSKDGRLAVSELLNYTKTELPRLLDELRLPQQTPLWFSWGNDFEILKVH